MNLKLKKILEIIISVLFWISIWAFVSFKISNSFLFPSPKDTLLALGEIIKNGDFIVTTLISFSRIILGIVIGVIIGIILGVLTAGSHFANVLMSPAVSAIKATPVASFIILVSIWLDKNYLPVFITALIVLPIVYTNTIGGLRSVSKELKEVAQIYSFSIKKRVLRLYLPTVLPYFLAALRASLGMAWKAGIAAEVLCTPTLAIGTELYLSKSYLEMPEMFAWTLVVIIISLIIEKVLMYLLSKLTLRCHYNTEGVNV